MEYLSVKAESPNMLHLFCTLDRDQGLSLVNDCFLHRGLRQAKAFCVCSSTHNIVSGVVSVGMKLSYGFAMQCEVLAIDR